MRAAKQRALKRVVHGLWWVDEAPENKVAGTLRYGFSGIELELSSDPLFGKDGNFAAQHEHSTKRPNTIIGLSDNGRDKFTIVDALPLRVGHTLPFFANHALRGAHLVDTSSREFTVISFEVEQLEAWAGGPLLEQQALHEGRSRFDSKTLFGFDTEKAKYEVRWCSFPFFRARESGNALTCSVVATFFVKVDLLEAFAELSKFVNDDLCWRTAPPPIGSRRANSRLGADRSCRYLEKSRSEKRLTSRYARPLLQLGPASSGCVFKLVQIMA